MGLTINLPDGDSVHMTKIPARTRSHRDEVQFSIIISGRKKHPSRQSTVQMRLEEARQLAKSILSITDPEGEAPVKQAPDWRCGSCRATQDQCRSSPGMKSCCTGCENTDGRIHGC